MRGWGPLGPLVVMGEGRPVRDETILLRGSKLDWQCLPSSPLGVFKTVGDAMHALFASPVAALRAALAAQAAVEETDWGDAGPLAVRMGVYTGEAVFVEGDWRGRPLNRCGRLRDAAVAGEI